MEAVSEWKGSLNLKCKTIGQSLRLQIYEEGFGIRSKEELGRIYASDRLLLSSWATQRNEIIQACKRFQKMSWLDFTGFRQMNI